jgi:dihydrofolate reductase
MGEMLVHEFMTLDGVVDAPTWTFDYGFDPKKGEAIAELTGRCGAILLGRTTYEMFEPAWSSRTEEDDPGAPFFNETPKYVVSSTLTEPTWRNSTMLGPYDPDAIRRLRADVDGDIYVSGSAMLVRGAPRRRPGRRAAPVRLPAHSRLGRAALPRRLRGAPAVAHGGRAVRERCRPPRVRIL